VVPMDDMVRKVAVAADSRSSADFLIIARTDARTALGLDEALRRGEAYARAGADIIFIEAPESEDELAAIAKRTPKPVIANMVHGGRTPVLPVARLAALGYAAAIFPTLGFLAAAHTLKGVYGELLRDGKASAPLYPFTEFNELIGFPDVWDFEKRFAETE